ncbi:MAG: D-cysteine desulfhydrase family protein [Ewingella americana]|jgi:D-cysteine desulfhydrase|uniref:D-cysteine desulfhydrase n=1 Tax=Ewingella americana (strain ATCC 33852 / DSM 4580 / CCUG 14506 / JCM 5911 / LMG 7869 / NCTC 12157 / CDC 1468-78) TaxID=910964 RepID=A0A085G272_EWIA3|nr:D-cysteine desulfhydrase family protein [Ewingella americana]KAA8726875.1 D-cysteine desulfhydrase family protein [Ewingella americana]KFC77817.1 D-cysteine desulfhydrase [Ewingella americana ATCC 33852]MCI1678330.1 D-cysteine desulfhydrase family protein [Ewingella americana]MCI1856033.1 D-cysteine desulfhydrase family protein [Ewingella americana]MCI1862258.1 D-cysteine desulfhydrase family protein [Ewingella americana]
MHKTDDFERVELGFFPTPLEPLTRLGESLGIQLDIKRDDYTGFGGGGNKVRKLEYLMADAVRQGINVIITTGGHQSNHARMVAAAARKFGMKPVLVLRGNSPESYQGNLLLDKLFGAELEFLDPDGYFTQIADAMQAHADAATARGEKALIIPLGGATPLGALGYVRAVEELDAQLKARGQQPPDVIVAPTGSGGTLAGLYVGARQYWPQTKIVGISVSAKAQWFQERISAMAQDCADLLQWPQSWSPEDIWIEDGFVGAAYGVPSEGGIEAIYRVAQAEGVLLDPVYTGKAMHGLISLVQEGKIQPNSRVIFVHCGGSPALYPFAQKLLER